VAQLPEIERDVCDCVRFESRAQVAFSFTCPNFRSIPLGCARYVVLRVPPVARTTACGTYVVFVIDQSKDVNEPASD